MQIQRSESAKEPGILGEWLRIPKSWSLGRGSGCHRRGVLGPGCEGPLWHDEEFEHHQWSADWGTVLAAVMADGERFRRTGEAQTCWTLLIRV